MKKMLKSLMLVAVAAMAFAGCSKEDVSDNAQPGSGTKTVRGFVAEIATSRTTLNDAATRMKWTAGDQLGFYTDVATDLNVASSTYADGAANFTAEIDTKATKVYAYYPYFNGQKDRTYENVSLYIEDAQTQAEAGVLDGQWVGMYASATLVEGENTVLTFTPIASLIAFNIYDTGNNGDKVKSVTFTPAGGEMLNGQTIYNLETGVTASTGTKTSAAVTLTTPYAVPAAKPADKTGYIYLVVSPKNYAGGGTFTVITDKNTYTFETTKAIDASNVYAPVVIPMNLVAAAPAENYSGTYVVLAKEGSTYFALAGTNNNNTTRLDAVPFEYNGTDTSISVTEPEIVWTVTKSGSAYTFSNDGKYLSYSGSSNTAAVNSTPYNLILLKDAANGTYNIKSETVSDRVLAKYSADNAYFAFYTTGGNKSLYLVPADYKKLPIIDLDATSAILDYNDETVHEITATVTDATSVVAAAYTTEEGSVESDWLAASYENGKVSYFASVNNTDKARTAYIIVSATNANGTRKEIITVVQNIQAQGTVVTFDYGVLYSQVSSSGNVDVTEDTVEGVTAKYVKVSGSNPPKYYGNGKNLRIYNKSTMTISAPAGSSIIKIEFTASTWTAGNGTVTADVGTLTSKTWTGENASVVFTFTASNRIESFVVTYK